MNDLGSLLKQAQAMQQKLQAAQARLAETEVEGAAGGGLVRLVLKGSGELARLTVDDSLLVRGEGEIIADLILAAHADAKRRLDRTQAEIMREVAGPLAGLAGIPGL
ncbi:MAG TPA: YbaB/EbfC family nucleoid-associated protein [Caulobacteraceae bacterium]